MDLNLIHKKVAELYKNSKVSEDWDKWTTWAYTNHVLVVASNAKKLAGQFGGNEDYCVAGALLHDIADIKLERSDENHTEESKKIVREVLKEAGVSEDEIKFIVEEIIAPHSCNETLPATLEGKILATADGMAHLMTDFYMYFAWNHWGNKGGVQKYEEFRKWVLQKIEKDFHKKIFFPEIQKEILPYYESLKSTLSKF